MIAEDKKRIAIAKERKLIEFEMGKRSVTYDENGQDNRPLNIRRTSLVFSLLNVSKNPNAAGARVAVGMSGVDEDAAKTIKTIDKNKIAGDFSIKKANGAPEAAGANTMRRRRSIVKPDLQHKPGMNILFSIKSLTHARVSHSYYISLSHSNSYIIN